MIFEKIAKFVLETVEYQDYQARGLSAVSLILFVGVLSSLIQGWGMYKQNSRIWNNKSGRAIPLTFFTFQFFYCMAYLVYGYNIKSGALILNNLVGFLYLPIIAGLIKFKLREHNSFKRELLVSPLLALIVPCVLIIKNEWALICILVIATAVFTHLVIEILQKKELKNIEPKYIYSVILGSGMWLWYGIEINDFGIASSSGSTIIVASLFAWFYFFSKRVFKKSPT